MNTTDRSKLRASARAFMTATMVGAVSLISTGCGEDSSDVTGGVPTASEVAVAPETHTLFSLGEKFQLSATAVDERGHELSGVTFDWSSRDVVVATVDSHGEVTGVGAGTAVIVASTGAARDSAVIWVDPELTLQNYCAKCHGAGSHGATFETNTCRACHSMSLTPLDDDHAATVNGHMAVSGGFQLAGAHETLACGMCHDLDSGAPLFTPADYTDCISCHLSEYEQQHGGSDYPTTCLTCHNMSSWSDVTFDHAAVSGGFELVGAHRSLPCTACHNAATGEPLYNPSGQDDCYACHQSDYQSEHAGSGYPTTCLTCHNTSGWGGASFDHATASGGFALIGTHQTLACTACHDAATGEPLYNPSGQDDCYACHQSDYQSEHAGSGYPTACLTCHNTSGWGGASFDHATASGGFNLVGTHQTLACTACHDAATGEPLYNPSGQDDCYACHQSDYQSEHAGSGYPTTCLTCHNSSGWGGASFNHDSQYFRIFSGTHAGRWAGCTTCHTNSNDYSEFTCFACHAHNQADMDSQHSSVSGYSYDSQRCRACHPNV